MDVLVFREAESAARTAEALRRRGHRPILLPLERVEATGELLSEGAWSGFCLTSARAAPPLAARFPGDARPVFAVGEASARAARQAGFPEVLAGEGTADRLGALASARLGARPAPLLYAAGRPRTGTLEEALNAAGLPFAVWEAYRTVPLDPGPEAFAAAGGAAARAALLLSVGQAEGFLRLAARLPALDAGRLKLACLSPRIAAALGPALCAAAAVAAEPRLDALLDRLESEAATRASHLFKPPDRL